MVSLSDSGRESLLTYDQRKLKDRIIQVLDEDENEYERYPIESLLVIGCP
jgi:hypothetical protein